MQNRIVILAVGCVVVIGLFLYWAASYRRPPSVHVSYSATSDADDRARKETEATKSPLLQYPHPKSLSAENTLRTILTAYIARDAEIVMAYMPWARESEDFARVRHGISLLMRPDRHVVKILSIRTDKVVDDAGDRLAHLTVQVEVTPGFKWAISSGKTYCEFHWALRQAKGEGPWIHDGGGF